jgi:hypothetical protein
MPGELVKIRTYGRWLPVNPAALDDARFLEGMEQFVAEEAVEWCKEHFLRPVSVATGLIADPYDDGRLVVLGEVRAAGLYVEPPRGWRAKLRAFVSAP